MPDLNAETSQKIENQLNLSLSLPESLRKKSEELSSGFLPGINAWDLIVKYTGDLNPIAEEIPIVITYLYQQYAIIRVRQEDIEILSSFQQIIYMEMPKNLFFEDMNGILESCIPPVRQEPFLLKGKNTLISIIDSGIDFYHPDFRNADGSTRILALWDQTIEGNPPSGYFLGSLYTKEQIDEALLLPRSEGSFLVPSTDISGHGTAVAGIACGNGRASETQNVGTAPEASLLVIKLANINNGFSKTTELMQAINFSISFALERGIPLAINLSFGNNYGSHDGTSLLETYMDEAASLSRNCIIVGAGNEGNKARHTSGKVASGGIASIDFIIGIKEASLSLQVWKSYVDEFDYILTSPGNIAVGPIRKIQGTQEFTVGNTTVLVYYSEPSPYQLAQEIFFSFLPKYDYLDEGIWNLQLMGRKVVNGAFDLWLPVTSSTNPSTGFLLPTEQTTLTIPSTSFRAISVGAYDSNLNRLAPFSGQGFTRTNAIKPDLVAPGVNINSTSVGGGYGSFTGTSFAAPFVTGSAALLMEWGILQGNDPYLYGEKVKAYLQKGAKPVAGIQNYPDPKAGWGALCLEDSLPE